MKSNGFTLVELLIILVVIAIISVVCFEAYSGNLAKSSREFVNKVNINNKLLEDKINEYRNDSSNQATSGQTSSPPSNQNPTNPNPPQSPITPPTGGTTVPLLSYQETADLFVDLQDKQILLFAAHQQALDEYKSSEKMFNQLKDNYFNSYQEYVRLSEIINERNRNFAELLAADVAKSKIENDKYASIQSEWYSQSKQTEYLKSLLPDNPNLIGAYNQSVTAEAALKNKLDKQEIVANEAIKLIKDNKAAREASIDKVAEKAIMDKWNNAKYEYDVNYSYLESEENKSRTKLFKIKEEYNNNVYKLGDAQRDLIYYHNNNQGDIVPEYDPTIL